VTLALYGVEHYMHFQGFSAMTTMGFGGILASLAQLWAYILPLLMIVGGGLLVVPYRTDIAAWCAGVAIASIAIGLVLQSVLGTGSLGDLGMGVNNALLWLLIYFFAVKSASCCCGGGKEGMGGVCKPGGGGCC
jgi:hypothetical protein